MSSSNQNTDTTSGGKRAAIKKMIDASIVTFDLPDCSPTEFFPPSRVAEIATLENISDYTAEDPSTQWSEEKRMHWVKNIHEKAPKLFICFAKNLWSMEFLNTVVNRANFHDKNIYGPELLETHTQRNGEWGLQDELIEEMEIHKMEPILPNDFEQDLVRKQHPFASVTRISGPASTLHQRYNVRIHEDYWNGDKNGGFEFLMVEYEERPGDEEFIDAIAGFFSRHETREETYCILLRKKKV